MGTEGGCFCLDAPENKPPPTNNAETIQRTRYTMSQLHEVEHGIQASTTMSAQRTPINNLTLELEISSGKLKFEEDPQICLF